MKIFKLNFFLIFFLLFTTWSCKKQSSNEIIDRTVLESISIKDGQVIFSNDSVFKTFRESLI